MILEWTILKIDFADWKIQMTKIFGIDVSQHNGNIDISKESFVIIRATWGTNLDTKLDYWVDLCNRYKKPYGLYCYSYALSEVDGKSEAEYLLKVIKEKKLNPQVGIWFDMEDADGYKAKRGALNKTVITQVCNGFLNAVKDTGYYYGIYSTLYWFKTFMPTIQCNKWVANWGTNNGSRQSDLSSECVLHQYTSWPYDRNVSYVDLAVFTKKPVKSEVKTVAKKKVNINDIIKSYEGKYIDIDNAYGGQCWDFVCHILEKYYGGKRIHCGISGYVKDIVAQKKTNGILTYCDEIPLNGQEMKAGDIVIWNGGQFPLSHIAIYTGKDENGNGIYIGQNQAKGQIVNQQAFSSANMIGCFRPKLVEVVTSGNTTATVKKVDQVLYAGEYVTSGRLTIKGVVHKNKGLDCIYIPELGSDYPLKYLYEYDDSDGRKDNHLSNQKATVYLDRAQVEKVVSVKENKVMVHGFTINATPLIEVA